MLDSGLRRNDGWGSRNDGECDHTAIAAPSWKGYPEPGSAAFQVVGLGVALGASRSPLYGAGYGHHCWRRFGRKPKSTNLSLAVVRISGVAAGASRSPLYGAGYGHHCWRRCGRKPKFGGCAGIGGGGGMANR